MLFQQSGPGNAVPVFYLPGVHGCWTPLDKAGSAISRHYDLTEIAYPLIEDWSLEHYWDALLKLMDDLSIESAHIVGESFGSLVGWQFGLSNPERIRSHILVGGLVRAPGLFRACSGPVPGFGASFHLPDLAETANRAVCTAVPSSHALLDGRLNA